MASNTPTLTQYEESIAPWNEPIDGDDEYCYKQDPLDRDD